jgi:alkaline phosphatase D
MPATEAAIVDLVADLKYANLKDRGYLLLTFTENEVRSDWQYVDTILDKTFVQLDARGYSATSTAGSPKVTPMS